MLRDTHLTPNVESNNTQLNDNEPKSQTFHIQKNTQFQFFFYGISHYLTIEVHLYPLPVTTTYDFYKLNIRFYILIYFKIYTFTRYLTDNRKFFYFKFIETRVYSMAS